MKINSFGPDTETSSVENSHRTTEQEKDRLFLHFCGC